MWGGSHYSCYFSLGVRHSAAEENRLVLGAVLILQVQKKTSHLYSLLPY